MKMQERAALPVNLEENELEKLTFRLLARSGLQLVRVSLLFLSKPLGNFFSEIRDYDISARTFDRGQDL